MKYLYLKNKSLVGLEFYNQEEYEEDNIVYTITRSDENSIDITWVHPRDGEDEVIQYISLDEFIRSLENNFYIIKNQSSFLE